ncbi:MAG: hypothetical protein AB8H47_18440 [Bacteroidia bacterium]
MKSKLIFCFAFFALMLSYNTSLRAQAAFNDTLFIFNQPLELASGGKFILGDGGLGFRLQPQSVMKVVTVSYSKKVAIPRTAKVSDKPIVLKNQNGCFEFSCGDGCDSCKLVWHDRNGDGKVQPRRELRCVNAKGKVSKISVQKVLCQ